MCAGCDMGINKSKFIYLILRNPCIFKENRHYNVRSLCIFPCFRPYERNKGNFLFRLPNHLIKQSCGSSFRFSLRVSVDVHYGAYVSVSEQFLYILGSRQAVDFIVSTVFSFYLFVVIEVVEFAILKAVLMLSRLCLSENVSQSVAEIHGADFLAFGGTISVLCLCPLYRILRRTVRYCSSRLMSCQVRPHTSPIRSPV